MKYIKTLTSSITKITKMTKKLRISSKFFYVFTIIKIKLSI